MLQADRDVAFFQEGRKIGKFNLARKILTTFNHHLHSESIDEGDKLLNLHISRVKFISE